MQKILKTLVIAFILIGCNNNQAQQTVAPVENIDAKKFKELSDASEVIILDVRTPEEVEEGYINGASAIDFYDSDFEEKINLIQKDKPVFVYCKGGGRSAQAAEILQKNGFNKVYNLSGGIMSWENNGFPVVIDVRTRENKITAATLQGDRVG
mgnify:CR=1 FL=1